MSKRIPLDVVDEQGNSFYVSERKVYPRDVAGTLPPDPAIENTARFARLPELVALRASHAAFHACAGGVVRCTDEGRKAHWLVEVKCTRRPEAQLLGSAIGMKVMEDVPYVRGLDTWLGRELNDENRAYLKDFGAATASNGAVGLYHIENLTPEVLPESFRVKLSDPTKYDVVASAFIGYIRRARTPGFSGFGSDSRACAIG